MNGWTSSPLDAPQLIKLLNQDQPVKAPAAKPKYRGVEESVPAQYILPVKGSYLVFQQDLLSPKNDYKLKVPQGENIPTENGGSSGHLLEDLAYTGIYAINARYLVTELRGGAHQLWVVEEPLPEIDELNGVSFRGTAYIAMRGFAPGRYLVLSKVYNTSGSVKVSVDAPWGEWIEPETLVGELHILVKNGKTIWQNRAEKRPVHQLEPVKSTLEELCAPKGVAKTIISLVGVSDRPLRKTSEIRVRSPGGGLRFQ